jgi:hypothetical protein
MLGLDPAIEERLQRVPVFCKQPLDEGFFRFGHDGQDIARMASAVG